MPNTRHQIVCHLKRCLPTRADIVWLLLIAMLCNAALPIASAGETNRMLMCTSSGYQWLEINDDANVTDRPHCSLCISSDQESDTDLFVPSVRLFNHVYVVGTAASHSTFITATSKTQHVRGPPITL